MPPAELEPMLALVTVTILFAGPAAGPAPVPPPRPDPVDHSAFDRILTGTVRDERIDYLEIRRQHLPSLVAYLERLAAVDDLALPRAERLALYLNAYNATMIRTVVERFRVGYTVAAGDHRVFQEPLVRLRGRTLSLNALENDVIRAGFGEPRIHVGLVCAARSCPPLLPRAFRGDDVLTVLEAAMARFVGDAARNEFDHAARRARLSRIFEWYASDFGGREGILAYVDRYHPNDVGGYSLDFLDYDWSLNLAPPAAGRWVAVVRATPFESPAEPAARAEVGEVFEVRGESDGALVVERPFGKGSARIAAGAVVPYPR